LEPQNILFRAKNSKKMTVASTDILRSKSPCCRASKSKESKDGDFGLCEARG
jgi:hypothetical protein